MEREARGAWLLRSSVGVGVLAAATGVVLVGWVMLHLFGVLSALLGAEVVDSYAAVLHQSAPLLWLQRVVLGTAAVLHVVAVVSLARRARRARPVSYVQARWRSSSWAGRSMRWSGGLLLAFVVLHLLHLTSGTLHPTFVAGEVYHNLIAGLSPPLVAAGYVVAAVLLGLHLRHGLLAAWRMFSVAPRAAGAAPRRLGLIFGVAIGVGFAVVPFAVAFGVLR